MGACVASPGTDRILTEYLSFNFCGLSFKVHLDHSILISPVYLMCLYNIVLFLDGFFWAKAFINAYYNIFYLNLIVVADSNYWIFSRGIFTSCPVQFVMCLW